MTPCLICRSTQAAFLLKNTRDIFIQYLKKDSVVFVICTSCGFVYQDPKPTDTELEMLYTRQYYDKKEKPVSEGYIAKKEEYARDTFQWLRRAVERIRSLNGIAVLDIGANTGSLLKFMQDHSALVSGYEPSARLVDIAHERYGVTNMKRSMFSGETVAGESQDLIMLVHTLEHILHPEKLLKDVHGALRDNGLLYVEVPDIYRPKSCFYVSYFSSPHLYMFSHASLANLLEQHGFRVVEHGSTRRGIAMLVQKTKGSRAYDGNRFDHYEHVIRLIHAYKKVHDRDAWIHKYVANSIPARLLMKSRLPYVSSTLKAWREKKRVNKVI